MTHRLLVAISDPEVASRAAALAAEGEGLEVVGSLADADEVTRTLRRVDVDVVLLHDALGATPALTVARDLADSFPEVGLVLLTADDSPDLLRAAMDAGMRRVITLPLSLEQLESSVHDVAQWTRGARERMAGDESAASGLGGQLIAVAGAKGGVGTTTVALQLALAAARAAPGQPVCFVDFDLQTGDARTLLHTTYRRSVVDLVEVAQEISVRHLQETLYSHRAGIRVLFAPAEGERAEEVDTTVARNVLAAVKGRHALTVVDLGSNVSEASAIGAEMASRLLIVSTPDVVSLLGVQRIKDLWSRLQLRDGDDAVLVLNRTSRKLEVQPDVARKLAGGEVARTTIPAYFKAFEPVVNTGDPTRLQEPKVVAAFDELAVELDALPELLQVDLPPDAVEPRGLLARLTGERGQSTVETMGLLPLVAVLCLALLQVGLTGYTYMLAGHAAREGARELATDPSEPANRIAPYEEAAREDIPKAWREGADVERRGVVTVAVRLSVPLVIPGLNSPLKIHSSASTSVEDAPLPPSQISTPVPPRRN